MSSSVAGRRCSAACRPAHGRSGSTARSSPTSTGLVERIGRRRVRRLDATWRAAGRPRRARRGRSTGWRPRRCSRSRAARSSCSSSATGRCRSTGRPVPSVLAVGSGPHRARRRPACAAGPTSWPTPRTSSTSTGWRWRSPRAPRAVHPRLAIELAAELAGGRGAEDARRDGGGRPACSTRSRPACARCSPGWASRAVASYVGGALFETLELAPEVVARCFPARGRVARPGRLRRASGGGILRSVASARAIARRRARPARRPGSRPLPGRRRAPPLRAARGHAPSRPSPTGSAADLARSAPLATPRPARCVRDGLRSAARAASGRSRSTRSRPPGRSPAGSSSRR